MPTMNWRCLLAYCAIMLSLPGLVSCTTVLRFSVSDLAFLDKQTTFDFMGSRIDAVGMLVATITTEEDIIKLVTERELNLGYIVRECDSGTELDHWPFFYGEPTHGSQYRYRVLFNYTNLPKASHTYNLLQTGEELCFQIGAGQIFGIRDIKSKEVKVSLSEGLREQLSRYDQANGKVKLTPSHECEDPMCIPSYAKQ